MTISKEARKVSRELFQACLKDGRVDEDRVRLIASKLIESKPRSYVEILKSFERLVRLELAKRHALVESVAELDSATREQLESTLRSKYGADLTTEFNVQPELIGGLRIKIGSNVFDSSVRERLNRLATALA